jgi:hypothetical protein
MENCWNKRIINSWRILKVIFFNYYINKSIFKEKRAQLFYASALCASFFFQHFCFILLFLGVMFVELGLINANANAKLAPLCISGAKTGRLFWSPPRPALRKNFFLAEILNGFDVSFQSSVLLNKFGDLNDGRDQTLW